MYPRKVVLLAIGVLLVLIFSKYFYVAGLGTFYTFYLIEKFGLSVQSAQVHLFVFLFASAIGTSSAVRSATASAASPLSGFPFSAWRPLRCYYRTLIYFGRRRSRS